MSDIDGNDVPEEHWGSTVYRIHWTHDGGGNTWVLSATEPEALRDENGRLDGLKYDAIEGTPHGDTVLVIDWSSVKEISFRPTRVTTPSGTKPKKKVTKQSIAIRDHYKEKRRTAEGSMRRGGGK